VQQYYTLTQAAGSLKASSGNDGDPSLDGTGPDYSIYSDCMTSCMKDSVKLRYDHNGNDDECHFNYPGRNGSIEICPPTDVQGKAVSVKTDDDEIVEYLSISWKPCSIGILDLRGFQVVIYLDFSQVETECFTIKFDEDQVLKHEDKDLRFEVIYPYKLQNMGEKYSFYVLSLPRDKHLDVDFVHSFYAKTCPDLYPNDYCHCGFEGLPRYLEDNPLDVSVQVDGYTVSITAEELDECFGIQWIQYQIWTHDPDSKDSHPKLHLEERETFRDFRKDVKRSTDSKDGYVQYQFKHMYNLKRNIRYFMTIQAIQAQQEPKKITERIYFTVKEWKPSKPEVIVSEHAVHVTYDEAAAGFDIMEYILALNLVDVARNTSKLIQQVTIKRNKNDEGKGEHVFAELDPGQYTVQVKEKREEEESEFAFSETTWGPPAPFTIVIDNSYAVLLTVVIITSILAVFVLIAVACVHFYRRGAFVFMEKCKPLTADSYSSPKVWVVWQADVRSIELQETHCENIRHFAAYLHTTCGFNVILDLFEKQEVYSGSYKWIQRAYKRADVIIFVCPHYDQTNTDTEANIYCEIGNFDASFRYLQSELSHHRSKFYTVTFPYSDLRASDACQWLKRTSTVFNITHDINELYCRLRGGDNLVCCTKLFAPRIDSKNSTEWCSLQEKLHDFSKVQHRYLHPDSAESAALMQCNEVKDRSECKQNLLITNNGVDPCSKHGQVIIENGKLPLPPSSDKEKLIPIISTVADSKLQCIHIEAPLSLDKYGETIELLEATSSSSSSL
jgi:hypothetical protein